MRVVWLQTMFIFCVVKLVCCMIFQKQLEHNMDFFYQIEIIINCIHLYVSHVQLQYIKQMMPSLYVPMLHLKEIHDCLALISYISIMSIKTNILDSSFI